MIRNIADDFQIPIESSTEMRHNENMMKLVFVSDSLKGSLSSKRTGELLQMAAESVYGKCETVIVPIADGGEGTLEAVLFTEQGRKETVAVHDPLNRRIRSSYGILSDGAAVIEMAAASGLTLLTESERNPLFTSTRGTGELIRDALLRGCKRITIAIGGSATNDGGMGCMRSLGIRFLDESGAELAGIGKDLGKVKSIDASGLQKEAGNAKITIMSDVTNPLCGENGATMTFGSQKGASADDLKLLEEGMQNYRDVIKANFGIDCDCVSGAGAAGGLGAALHVFLQGQLRSGIETMLDLVQFDKLIKDADLIVTGEGRADEQSCHGKVMQGVGLRAKKAGIPAVGLCGMIAPGAETLKQYGITELYATKPDSMPLAEAMEKAEELYLAAAKKMFEGMRKAKAT